MIWTALALVAHAEPETDEVFEEIEVVDERLEDRDHAAAVRMEGEEAARVPGPGRLAQPVRPMACRKRAAGSVSASRPVSFA